MLFEETTLDEIITNHNGPFWFSDKYKFWYEKKYFIDFQATHTDQQDSIFVINHTKALAFKNAKDFEIYNTWANRFSHEPEDILPAFDISAILKKHGNLHIAAEIKIDLPSSSNLLYNSKETIALWIHSHKNMPNSKIWYAPYQNNLYFENSEHAAEFKLRFVE